MIFAICVVCQMLLLVHIIFFFPFARCLLPTVNIRLNQKRCNLIEFVRWHLKLVCKQRCAWFVVSSGAYHIRLFSNVAYLMVDCCVLAWIETMFWVNSFFRLFIKLFCHNRHSNTRPLLFCHLFSLLSFLCLFMECALLCLVCDAHRAFYPPNCEK